MLLDFENNFSWVLSFRSHNSKIWDMSYEKKTENSTKHYFNQWVPRILSFELRFLSYMTRNSLIQTPYKYLWLALW